MKVLRWLLLLCLPGMCLAQGSRFDTRVVTSASNVPFGSQATLYTSPGASIRVCAYPATGSPCTNAVNVYSNQALTVLISQPITADAFGRFGFWLSPGTYAYNVTTQAGTNLGNFTFTIAGTGGGSATFPSTPGLVWSLSSSTARNATRADVVGLWTSCTGTMNLRADGTCANSTALSLTTTGTSGLATLNSGVLNIPNYTLTTALVTALGTLTNDTSGSAAKIGGVAVSGTPAAGQAIVALGTTTASWQTLTATATPGGATGNMQYNNAGTLGGIATSLVATSFTGADIGAKINAAYAALPANGGEIVVPIPVGGFSFSTPIVIGTAGKPALITCTSNPGAGQSNGTLTFTPTSGSAITYNIATSGTTTNAVPRGYGLRQCKFQGSHGTSVGLTLGGNNGGQGFTDEGSTINAFGTDLAIGDNSFFIKFTGTYFGQDTTGVLVSIPNGTNTGEEIVFDSVTFHEGNAGAVNIQGAEVLFLGAAFDNAQLVASSAFVSCVGCHFENPDAPISYPFVLSNGNTSLIDTQILDDNGTGSATSAISATGGTLKISGLDGVFQASAYTSVIAVSGAASVFETDPVALHNTVPLISGSTTGRYFAQNDPLCRNFGDSTQCSTYVSNLPIATTSSFAAGVSEFGYQSGGYLQGDGTRMQGTPDASGYYTGKYLFGRDTTDGCNSYASELDFYTENKPSANANDTSTLVAKIDCHGSFHAASLADGILATTQSANDNSAKVATTAYVDSTVTAATTLGFTTSSIAAGTCVSAGVSSLPGVNTNSVLSGSWTADTNVHWSGTAGLTITVGYRQDLGQAGFIVCNSTSSTWTNPGGISVNIGRIH